MTLLAKIDFLQNYCHFNDDIGGSNFKYKCVLILIMQKLVMTSRLIRKLWSRREILRKLCSLAARSGLKVKE